MGWFDKGTKSPKNKNETKKLIHVQEHIGSGSYGTVHLVSFQDDDGKKYVAKRAWTLNEIKVRPASTHKEGDTKVADPKALKGKAERCQYYLNVEQHCLDKIRQSDNADQINVPAYAGKYRDDSEEGNEWLLFDLITSNSDSDDKTVAKNLKEVMELDWIDQHREDERGQDQHHHLYMIHKELGLQDDATFEDTLDAIFMGILKTVSGVHETNIVHRDIKPENLLIDGKNKDFILIDFGSAQDVDVLKKMVFVFEGEATGKYFHLSPIS
jgi:serine/threonine protein kinase